MRKNWFIPGIIFLFLCVFQLDAFAQSARKAEKQVNKRKEQLEKQSENKDSEKQAEIEAAKQRHLDIQTKEVRKRMKKSRKKADRYNKKKKGFFLTRWFR